MSHFMRNMFCSTALALADFISFTASLYFALGVLSITLNDFENRVTNNQIEGWIYLHWLLGACCVAWFGIRLRHYFYRKTFWLELKEILRTLLIFAVFEIAVMAFAKWYFSRYLWLLTWCFAAALVPLSRMATKWILNRLGLWLRETWVIGSGKNARDAWLAINSERNLGLKISGFVSSDIRDKVGDNIYGVPIVLADKKWLLTINKQMQFIVAVEAQQSDLRNNWLREFMIKGYRYVSIIPTLRGVPLDSTDMSFIFSHEVMIFRVQHNLAKWSSRVMKRLFDIVFSIAIILMLSPLLIYISRKVKKDGGPAIYGHERVGKSGRPFKCLKFRSMVINSKEVLDHVLSTDVAAREEWNSTFKLKNDPRITPIGHFLRRTSLDELPQLFNVFKGGDESRWPKANNYRRT
ncbi:Putative colanic biosynthesis UDP-glucose lipid carrier transferase [Shimwellia blattae]|nr:Putative colanic biosynthesis UDP-glucose lipid carrier transferase [Shimwellia blattae]